MVENWKADADGILIFVRFYLLTWCFTPTQSSYTGLFFATVASLISVSIQDIRQNPQDTSNFYLANIYQTLTDPNQSNISSSFPATPPPFSPPTYAVWVNALWFLSLVTRSVLPVLYSRPCSSNGHDDISRSLSRVTVRTSAHGFVPSLPKELRNFSSHGRSKHYPHFSTFPCSCFSPASLCSFGTLISHFSNWCCLGSAFARLSTDASRSCQYFVTTARTTPHSRCRRGTSSLEYHFSHFGLFGGSHSWIFSVMESMIALITRPKVMVNYLCRACRRRPRKLH